MDLMTALATLGQAIGLVKDLNEINKGLNDAEFKAKLAKVNANLADVEMALTDATVELREKDAKIERVKKAAAKKADLVEITGFPYEKNAQGHPEGLPFCPVCLEDELHFYRMVREVAHGSSSCPKCKTNYGQVSRMSAPNP